MCEKFPEDPEILFATRIISIFPFNLNQTGEVLGLIEYEKFPMGFPKILQKDLISLCHFSTQNYLKTFTVAG